MVAEIGPYFKEAAAGGLPLNGGGEEAVKDDFDFYTTSGALEGEASGLKVEDFWEFAPLKARARPSSARAEGGSMVSLTKTDGAGRDAPSHRRRVGGAAVAGLPPLAARSGRSPRWRSSSARGRSPGAFRSASPFRPSPRRCSPSSKWSSTAPMAYAYFITLQPLVIGVAISAAARRRARRRHGAVEQAEWLLAPIFIVLQAAPMAALDAARHLRLRHRH